jgi:hypothetical protein
MALLANTPGKDLVMLRIDIIVLLVIFGSAG